MPAPRPLALLDAPTNLGLRPPAPGVVPGCHKAPGALRDLGLLRRLEAEEAGVVTPPRYEPEYDPRDGVRNGRGVAAYSAHLAGRLARLLDGGRFPVVLGGDCSVLLGAMLALSRRGRHGLAHVDGHTDFRHPGNAPAVVAAAGEDLALVLGLGDPRLLALGGGVPLARPDDVVQVGARPEDEGIPELRALGATVLTSADLRREGPEATADAALRTLASPALDGFWIHLDVDVIDGGELPAVDSPEPGGPSAAEVTALVRRLAASPRALGLHLTIYDPDLDPGLAHAATLADLLVAALRT